jgi:guanidinobutyrase
VAKKNTKKTAKKKTKDLNQPLGGNIMLRAGAPITMMRLPTQEDARGLDACFVGIPLDWGTSNRSGSRFGPRQIRQESAFIRPYNMATRAAPFDALQVADINDVPVNPYDLKDSCRIIEKFYREKIMAYGARPLTMGGDHTITYPILQAIKKKWGPVGLIHIDAHADVNDTMFGEKIAHGTPFRRCVEEGLIDCNRTWQIGLRGTGYTAEDFDWCRRQGFRLVLAHEVWWKSLVPLMAQVRKIMGKRPMYISFDVDGLDPAYGPGNGSPEIGGITAMQALEIIRGCRGLNVVGGDFVEVAPVYDVSGNTSLYAANFLYEMLCVLPGVPYRK